MDYTKVIKYVWEMTNQNGRPDNYPFRSRYDHIMRVYRWAIKLQAREGGDLEIISLAALFHDIGWDPERPHWEVSAEMAVEYLAEQDLEEAKIGRIGDIILRHNDKDTTEDLSLECRIVMDADLLDEVGAMSVLWDSMATACEEEASYKKAYTRIKNYYRINQPKISRCKTATGRLEYTKRMKCIEDFLNELERELF
jgi:uncharacterized protein